MLEDLMKDSEKSRVISLVLDVATLKAENF